MTCPTIPDYVLQVLEAEVAKITWTVIEKLCDSYKLDKSEVQNTIHKCMFTEIDVHENETIRIIRCKPRAEKSSSERCKAFVGSLDNPKQCKNSWVYGSHFCKTHQRMFDAGSLKLGHIPIVPVKKKVVQKI